MPHHFIFLPPVHLVMCASVGRYQPVEEDDDDEDDEDEEQNPYGGRLSQTVIPSRQPWQTGGTLVPERSTLRPATFDERPITPMKNTMVYSREYSTLDFKDGKLIIIFPPIKTDYSVMDKFSSTKHPEKCKLKSLYTEKVLLKDCAKFE